MCGSLDITLQKGTLQLSKSVCGIFKLPLIVIPKSRKIIEHDVFGGSNFVDIRKPSKPTPFLPNAYDIAGLYTSTPSLFPGASLPQTPTPSGYFTDHSSSAADIDDFIEIWPKFMNHYSQHKHCVFSIKCPLHETDHFHCKDAHCEMPFK